MLNLNIGVKLNGGVNRIILENVFRIGFDRLKIKLILLFIYHWKTTKKRVFYKENIQC